MRTAKEFTIDGEKYLLGHWAPDKATEIFAWLVQSIGPGVKGAFQSLQQNSGGNVLDVKVEDIDLKVGIELLDTVITNLSKSLTPTEYSRRMKEILSGDIIVNGRELIFDNHFRGKQKLMHRLALEVIKYQFADFFEDALSTFQSSGQQTTSPHLNRVN